MRFLNTKSGTVHVDTSASCSTAKHMMVTKAWKGRRSLTPEQALEYKDCAKCESHKLARSKIREAKAVPLTKNAKAIESLKKRHEKIMTEDKGNIAAHEHAKLAEEHGWTTTFEHEEPNGWLVTATKDDETVQVAWVNGKVDYPRVIAVFPTYTFWLKNTSQWRRQVMLPESERPASRESKTARKPKPKVVAEKVVAAIHGEANGVAVAVEDEVKFNMTSLPFPHDAEDIELTNAIRGKVLYWRNNMAAKVNHATVPSNPRVIRVSRHVRSQRRIVSFPESHTTKVNGALMELLGAERSVAVEDMIRVR